MIVNYDLETTWFYLRLYFGVSVVGRPQHTPQDLRGLSRDAYLAFPPFRPKSKALPLEPTYLLGHLVLISFLQEL